MQQQASSEVSQRNLSEITPGRSQKMDKSLKYREGSRTVYQKKTESSIVPSDEENSVVTCALSHHTALPVQRKIGGRIADIKLIEKKCGRFLQ